MDTVLGLSMTPTTVGLILVEADGRDGATKDHDAFEVRRGGFSPVTTSEYVAEALSRTQAIAGGQHLQSIGVTWSDDATIEASLLLDSLADSGFHNVIPIRLPEATEAFARGIGEVIGSNVTSVCVVEPEAAVVLVVDSYENAVQTAVSYDLETDQDLTGWLSDVLNRDGWQPDGLVLLGSGDDFDTIARRLELVLGIPVFAPAEAELALARGAALASVNGIGMFDDPAFAAAPSRPNRRLDKAAAAPLAMLIGGVLTFVVSASVAVGIQLLPDRAPRTVERSVVNTAETPTIRPAGAPVLPAPPPQVLAPPPEEPPLQAPPPETMSEPAPEVVAQTEEPAAVVPAEPPAAVPAVPVEPTVPPVSRKPSLRERILQHLPGMHAEPPAAG